jgi:CheY-like chemotaxis protein
MKFAETSAYRGRAAHCANQSGLTQDTILKKFWDDLADDWLALGSTTSAANSAKPHLRLPARKVATVLKAPSQAPARKRRVVIIDDDPAFAKLLTTLVGGLGHDVIVKEDSSASDTYEVRDSDIVFVDLMMPKVSGIQVLEQLGRQNVKSAIVLVSSNDKSLLVAEQVVKKLDLDLLGVLHKPFQLPDVRSVLEAA